MALRPVRDALLGRRFFASVDHGSASGAPHVSAPPKSERVMQLPRSQNRKTSLTLEELAGQDPQMLRNVRSAHRIAMSRVPVMIQGPTGAGKEMFARALHAASDRAAQQFVALNCAAIPESLIESELFGYRSGAFTGARKEGMRGKILQSSGGTLFLDEIGDMPLALQTRLLRVLEEQEVLPLGTETPVKVDVRVISASHQNLRSMLSRGEFREDLYYRLNGITLELPPLAMRTDKERLIREFLAAETDDDRPAAIEIDAFGQLLAYRWPGNVRELRNVIRTALAICDGGVVRLRDLPSEVREIDARDEAPPPRSPSIRREQEKTKCSRPFVIATATCRGLPNSSASAAIRSIVGASASAFRYPARHAKHSEVSGTQRACFFQVEISCRPATMRSKKQSGASRPVVRLAQGVRIDGDEKQKDAFVLVCPDGKVHLNRTAAAILRLCDGSHDRDGLVAEVVRRSSKQARAAEIIEFLDVARARGWIDEA